MYDVSFCRFAKDYNIFTPLVTINNRTCLDIRVIVKSQQIAAVEPGWHSFDACSFQQYPKPAILGNLKEAGYVRGEGFAMVNSMALATKNMVLGMRFSWMAGSVVFPGGCAHI